MGKPKKPSNVPKEAVWNKKENEWELGKKNTDGQPIGEWKWWLAPEGHLVCQTFYEGDSGQNFKYTRFHPDGTYSQKGTYVNGIQHGTFYYQSSVNETKEQSIPHQAPDNVFSMIYEYEDGQIISSQFFDNEGYEVDQYGDIINPKKSGNTPEDAVWNEEGKVWEKGAYKDNQKNGIWTGWNTKGEKSTEIDYENGEMLEERGFHPDGTLSFQQKYGRDGVIVYKMYCQSKNSTTKYFPEEGVANEIFKLEYFYDEHGYTDSWKGYDIDGNIFEEHTLYNSLDNRTEQTRFNSFEAASKIWKEKGDKFYKDINWWLGQYYQEKHDVPEGTPEPEDKREDMERVILDALKIYNKEGNPLKVRELFPPSYEPISEYTWDNFGKSINRVIAVDENTILANVEKNIYVLKNQKITLLKDVYCIGNSKNKKYIAKAYVDRIEVTEGLDGEIVSSFKYPKKFNKELYHNYDGLHTDVFNHPLYMGLVDIKVSSNGTHALLISKEGIYLLRKKKPIHIYPDLDKLEEMADHFEERSGGNLDKYFFELGLSYPNADFSVNDKYIVASAKIPSPIYAGTSVYKYENGELELMKYGEQESMFGIVNQFHTNGRDMLHAACMYASIDTNWSESMKNTTFRLTVDQIEDGEDELDNFAGGYRQAAGIVHAACPIENGFGLGVDNGYLWWHGPDSSLHGYLHVGGSITALDVTTNNKYLIVATNQGQIIKLKFIKERGTGIITDMKLKDEKRYIFFKTFDPMIW